MIEPASNESTGSRKYYGKYPGLVVKNTLPEGDPRYALPEGAQYGDHRGELLVEVSGILEETADGEGQQAFQVWAKPCFLPGFFFMPEKGAQVWVEFVAGDINSPVWTGVWYPKDSTPDTIVEESRPTEFQKIIRTASGHVVQLDDTKDKEQVVITHKGGAIVQIDQDGSVLITNQTGSLIHLNAKDGSAAFVEEHGHVITMTEQGIVLMNAEGSTAMLAGDTVRVSAANVALEGTVVALGAGAAEPTLLGTTFSLMYNTHTHPTPMGPSGPPIPTGPPLGPGQGLTSAVVVG